jgi:histidinol-phosphatase (PHP family)
MKLLNLHNHTPLCGHATGSVDDYVEAAIKQGAACIGFSDHAPLPAGLRDNVTMSPEQTEDYISMLESARKKHQDRIEILIGFEVDFPLHEDFSRSYFFDERLDYLIGSCHFIDGWAFDHEGFINEFSRRDINDIYGRYYEIVEGLIDSRLFNIMGHFDLVKKFGHRATADFSETIEALAGKLAACGMAFEVNTSGLIKPVGEMYPSRDIIEIFFRKNVAVTLGSDSHAPEHVCYGFDLALEELRRAGYRKITGFRKRRPFEILL